MSDNIVRPIHQMVDNVLNCLERLEKQLELMEKIIEREPGNQERSEENDT